MKFNLGYDSFRWNLKIQQVSIPFEVVLNLKTLSTIKVELHISSTVRGIVVRGILVVPEPWGSIPGLEQNLLRTFSIPCRKGETQKSRVST